MRQPGAKGYGGIRMVESDLLRELAWAVGAMTVLLVVLALVFSSPDPPTLTARQVATRHPVQLVRVALRALDGQGAIASYGPPYNHGRASLQRLGPFAPQAWAGVTIPVRAAQVFVLEPLRRMVPLDPGLAGPLNRFAAASPAVRAGWERAYGAALGHAQLTRTGQLTVATTAAGPLPALMNGYLALARTGALESVIDLNGRVYQTDFTRALLLLQGAPLQSVAKAQHLLGTQWGMMKEPGNYPGAVWLWLYTLLYQIPPYTTSAAGDLLVGLTVGAATLVLLLVPWIPGIRDIPYILPIYRRIWRRHYQETEE